MKKIDADIERLQQELEQVRALQSKERRDAHVNVEAAADTDLDLTLTYQSMGARWTPVYDARLDTGTGDLDLEQYGSVTQMTGEDWNDVDLTLSTARPAAGSEMPTLHEWFVALYQPIARLAAASGRASLRAMSALKEAPAPAPAAQVAMDAAVEPQAAEVETASVEASDYSAEFKVPAHVDLKSSRDSTKLRLGEVKLKASLMAQTSPRLGAQAYLFAQVTNHEAYPFIPGMVAKYRDGAFIGNAQLPMVRPDEEAKFAFGVDDHIKVEYKQINESKDNPTLVVVGDVTDERHYQAKVENLHKDPIVVSVFDQYPVSTNPDVTVTLLEDATTPGYVDDPDKTQGVITWTDTLAPKQEKTYTIGFKVKYPKGQIIQGM